MTNPETESVKVEPVNAWAGSHVKCYACDGSGIVDAGYHNPEECSGCNGSGSNWRYPSGIVAKYYTGPFIGRVIPVRIVPEVE